MIASTASSPALRLPTSRRTPPSRSCPRSCRRRCAASSAASCAGSTGASVDGRGRRGCSAAENSPSTQFAASLRGRRRPSIRRRHRRLEVIDELARRGQLRGVVVGDAVQRDEACPHRLGQLRQRGAHAIDPRLVDHQRRQVGIGEIAIVLRVFLAAHRPRLVAVGVVEPRLLHDACRRPRSARSGGAPRSRSPAAGSGSCSGS